MTLRDVLLAELSKRPNTGYGLNRRLRDELSHIWHARLQQVYRELGRLQEEGLVRVECLAQGNRPDKKRYSLTQAGTDELDAWLATAVPPPAMKNEGFIRLYCIERASRDVVERQLAARGEQWRRRCQELAGKLDRARAAGVEEIGYLLTVDAALAQAEANAAWCVKALGFLRSVPQAQSPGGDGGPNGRARLSATVAAASGLPAH